jgi:hypothetical protein
MRGQIILFRISLGLALAVFATVPAVAASAQRQSTRSPHGPLNIPCENCHTATGWTPIRAVPEFNHDSTRYPLRGMHEKVSCTGCHLKPVFTDVGKNCADCHADIHRRQFGANCAQCHTVNGWNVSVQAINNHFNRFPLLGAHAVVECDQCHTNAAAGQFTGLSTACNSCHMKDWQNTTSPPHAKNAKAFPPNECQQCHRSFDTWLNASFSVTGGAFDHAAPPINFPLTLGHASVACEQCHVGGNYQLQIAASDCGNSMCHLTTWNQTNDPPHAAHANWFPVATCSQCHTTPAGWTGAPFPNHGLTGFDLIGRHVSPIPTPCESCHTSNNYNLTMGPTDCGNQNCHLNDWKNTTVPVHSTAGPNFAVTNCSNCHTPQSWATATFDHSTTGFALVGTHMSTPCASCHSGPNAYSLTSADCYSSNCHQTAYQSTTSPNHALAGFPTGTAQCAACHPITTWLAGTFNHAAPPINFALTNAHATLACSQCHVGNNYSLQIALNDCGNSQCHLITYNQTNNPPHLASAALFPITQCSNCHTTVSWTAAFDHSKTTFPLTGAHLSVACATCHTDNYAGTLARDCYTCHLKDWNSTQTLGGAVPNHVTSVFPHDCTLCHSTTNWTTSTFNHNATTFPLLGAHTTVACATCHTDNYAGTLPTTCVPCHQNDYNSTANLPGIPNHAALIYPTTCLNCHNMTNWLGALFNHSATRFGALTGVHATIACNLCHTSATPPPLDCYSCHTVAWQSTATLGGQVPDHTASGATLAGIVPSACGTCHTTTNWLGAPFTHSWFNQQHGNSGGVCTICHISVATSGYSVFQCIGCHGNNNAANFHHPNVGGYAYSSPACYQCHSRG